MTLLERFIKYISIPTTSDSKNLNNPSTENQRIFAEVLIDDLKNIGIDEIEYDEKNCYIYACLKGNSDLPKVGFVAHMDTCEDAKGEDIKPRIIKLYDGKSIKYPNGLTMKIEDNPDLVNHIGKTLIVTDGTTLLGADDKAGIVEIMGMLEDYKKASQTHGDIYVCFTPDEEIGLGVNNFNKNKFPVDFAFTIDGSSIGNISYENFNAATAEIEIKGVSTHCGYAKNKMVNALLIANQINNLLPDETPSNTENYAGFYHLEELHGDVTKATMKYLIRDFELKNFIERKNKLQSIVNLLNKKYGSCISLKVKDSYYNMKDYLDSDYNIFKVIEAMDSCGITSKIVPTRGGTDGAELTYMGIPCPNIGTGGHNFHSVYEYVAVEDMIKNKDLLVSIVHEYSKTNKTNSNNQNDIIKRVRKNN